ncbi:MAG: vWA domain-containing protein [bacterium]
MTNNDEVYLMRGRLETTTKELASATGSKKRFKWLALGLLLIFILILAMIYKVAVLDYAEIENVKIEQEGNIQKINFAFDVKTGGRLDYHYGKTVLIDRKKSEKNQIFHWALDKEGETEISIRSRRSIFPKWYSKIFLLPSIPLKDIALLMDCSGSMGDQCDLTTGEITREAIMEDVKQSAYNFLDCIDNKTKVGLISFGRLSDDINAKLKNGSLDMDAILSGALDGESHIEAELTCDRAELKKKISALSPMGGTPMDSAIALACNEMLRDGGVENIIVLLTDGIPNDPVATESYANQAKASGVKIITIGVGPDVDIEFLKKIASTSDDYYFAKESSKLKSIFAGIANELSGGK